MFSRLARFARSLGRLTFAQVQFTLPVAHISGPELQVGPLSRLTRSVRMWPYTVGVKRLGAQGWYPRKTDLGIRTER